jgi:hypothetical protein
MEHREAVESDLMQTGYTLDDVGASLSWDALKSFLTYARPDSALFRQINPELADWSVTLKTNIILADIYDQLAVTNALLRTVITHKRSKPPEPYKRPGKKKTETRHIGSKPLANVDEMREWIRQRQRQVVKDVGNE